MVDALASAAIGKAESLGLTGSSATIVATLQKLTARPIQTSALRNYFRDEKLLMIRPDGVRGSLAEIVSDEFDQLIDGITDPDKPAIEANTLDRGPEFYSVLTTLVAGALLSAEQADAIFALGGGRPWSDLSAEDYSEALTAKQTAEADETKFNGWKTKFNSALNKYNAGQVAEAQADLASISAEMGA